MVDDLDARHEAKLPKQRGKFWVSLGTRENERLVWL